MITKVKFLIPLTLLLILGSCTEYNKLLKSNDNEEKRQGALRYYEEEEWIKSITLLEDIIPYYKLTAQGEELYFKYCMASYQLEDYILAGYYFKRFVRQYPTSKNPFHIS